MANREQRSNREKRKPKANKPKPSERLWLRLPLARPTYGSRMNGYYTTLNGTAA
jgi:hypothetical protein